MCIFTARKHSLRSYVCIPECLARNMTSRGGGWSGTGLGGAIPACTEADTPSRRLLLRAVRILLECILVGNL